MWRDRYAPVIDAAVLDYELPAGSIAQVPAEPRDRARLLVDRGPGRAPDHRRVADLAELVGPGDLLVVNDTRVRPARLALTKPTGGAVEVLLLDERAPGCWEALVGANRRPAQGTELCGEGVVLRIGADLGDGRRMVEALAGDPLAVAEIALPPYIHTTPDDPERYQTVFGEHPGSVAAPTAGLHLTEALLERCREAGAGLAAVTLDVGPGTFRPLAEGPIESQRLHAEAYRVPAETLARVSEADRVIAVGTTVVRALESAAATGERAAPTELFIRRGHRFASVDALMTNFHVPRSSLLALVDAFIGDRWWNLYATALAEGYRFLSFGDAMFLPRRDDDVLLARHDDGRR